MPLPDHYEDFGRFEDLGDVLARQQIDMLVARDCELDHRHLTEAINLCEKEMVGFQLVPTCFRVLSGGDAGPADDGFDPNDAFAEAGDDDVPF